MNGTGRVARCLILSPYSYKIFVRRNAMIVKITSKRQVTFPARVLDALGVGPGDQLELQESPDGLHFATQADRPLQARLSTGQDTAWNPAIRHPKVSGSTGARVWPFNTELIPQSWSGWLRGSPQGDFEHCVRRLVALIGGTGVRDIHVQPGHRGSLRRLDAPLRHHQ